MSQCSGYNPDETFERFEVIEFPTSYVGLATIKNLEISVDLHNSAYFKTLHQGKLMKFDDARKISPSHRAFNIKLVDNHNVEITFTPTNECISKARKERFYDDIFVFDLRLIKVDGSRCCNDESHSEIGRYYISGEFKYSQISHTPEVVDFGNILINTEGSKSLVIRNDCNTLVAKMQYVTVPGFKVTPTTITVLPNTSKKISIKVRPTSFKLKNIINFKIINSHDSFERHESDTKLNENNFLIYVVNVKTTVLYQPQRKHIEIESLHKLVELNPLYTYDDDEIPKFIKRKNVALTYLQHSKYFSAKKRYSCKLKNENQLLCHTDSMLKSTLQKDQFCKNVTPNLSIYDLLQIQLDPLCLNFGKVATHTYGECLLTIHNKTEYLVCLEFLKDNYITYSNEKKSTQSIKLKGFSKTSITVYCFGHMAGKHKNTFEFVVQKRYHRKHFYCLEVNNPILTVYEKTIKFGMVTPETFTVSVPIRIYNHFNIPIEFEWEKLNSDTPFDIIPKNGKIAGENCTICDIFYKCKSTKTKTHELSLMSLSVSKSVITIESTIITRKLSIKFLQPAISFRDIPLNLETVEKIRMENSSREIALFHVVEQLIPGIRVEPMSGIIGPKMIITFDIIVKIPCALEFAFDIYVKINNKENVILPVSGNVVEPRIIIHPKNVNMTRVPCNMVTYVPLLFQNMCTLKTVVEVLGHDENIFNVYSSQGNENSKLQKFVIGGGQSKTVYIKVFDIFRREYEMFMPFIINGLLGPPNNNPSSTELQYYIKDFEKLYENNPKIKIKTANKEISYCRIAGVITVPWMKLSQDKFEIQYDQNTKERNVIKFTVTNVSKYYLYVTILTSMLVPNFSLTLGSQSSMNETQIKFDFEKRKEVELSLVFHPKEHGKFTSTALLYLDKNMTIPYYNLTFFGIWEIPKIYPSTYRIIFPPCNVGEQHKRTLILTIECKTSLDCMSSILMEESCCSVDFIECNMPSENISFISVEITVNSFVTLSRTEMIKLYHNSGSYCIIEIYFCYTYCPITLHVNYLTNSLDNPYPYYPLPLQSNMFVYMEKCTSFLEKWMFQQGFHRDLYPKIPDTFHIISNAISSQPGKTKPKGVNVSYLSFVRRIAGPLMKHIHKITVHNVEESFKWVKEIHDTYREIISLLKSRGANLWMLQAKFLLSYEQFVIYSENITPKFNADVLLTQQLIANVELFNRLNKQSWIDFILQSYKVFIMDSCFFDCVCLSSQPRDIVKVLMEWYNDNISKYQKFNKTFKTKPITNLTTDLSNGIVIIMTILNYCPFMEEHFSCILPCDTDTETCSVNNACLIIEAFNALKLYFPLTSKDLLEPTFLQMLFLSTHLFVTLPMFEPKEVIYFNPPLLKSSSRQISINSSNQESLTFNFILINNLKNNFAVEKVTTDNGKKMCLNVKYTANFVEAQTSTLLIHGYNKTRIFDTYIVFFLCGRIGAVNPLRKCKVSGPLYRPNKVDVLISSPFLLSSTYSLHITDDEPTIPIVFHDNTKPRFYLQRLNLIDSEIHLSGIPKESGQEVQEHKLYFYIICLNTLLSNSWVWFRSEIGEFFIKVTTQPRWDLAVDTLYVKTNAWPIDPCSCGEDCECYRTTAVAVPHRNELMVKSLRVALCEHASETMMQIFDKLIKTITGKRILIMLLEEGGTNLSDIQHILQSKINYRITSRSLSPGHNRVTLDEHSSTFFVLPITLPVQEKTEKFSITLTSDCGMDIRMYKIVFIGVDDNSSV